MLNHPTISEWASLKATLISLHNPRFLCDKCLKKYPRQPERLEAERQALGCFDVSRETVQRIDDVGFKTCPGNLNSEGAVHWIEFHPQFQNGVMPFEGAYFDQPAKAIEVMRIIGNYKTEWELEQAKAAAMKKAVKRGR